MSAPTDTPRFARVDRMVEWLRKHHHQSSGAARSLRSAALLQTDSLVIDQKRKAADAASANAACYHEIAEALLAIRVARQHLTNVESGGISVNVSQRNHFVEAVDRALGISR